MGRAVVERALCALPQGMGAHGCAAAAAPAACRGVQRPGQPRLRRVSDVPATPPLSRLLERSADAVQAVRAGRSLTAVLAEVPGALRPGVQALAFHALRQLGGASEVLRVLAPKPPPPPLQALLCVALALLWPMPQPPYAAHTLVDQAVVAARRRAPGAAAFVNAVLRRFVREREALVARALGVPTARWNHPAWWIEQLRGDWPAQWQALLTAANQHPPMTLRVNRRHCSGAAYQRRCASTAATARRGQPPPGGAGMRRRYSGGG